ncbi:GDP-D-glucose phosphorylase 1 [Holothuria leucospilota]|uniref:GDP-D-glucose phosphorylase 1 n=1 Tax=Holothuria leucospilota TaxID=206669 RepID=A0A9Q1CHZ4_HOLLE|nr:GDP-D-glucose phosphorylase 1 [Holothuria leucospilota]
MMSDVEKRDGSSGSASNGLPLVKVKEECIFLFSEEDYVLQSDWEDTKNSRFDKKLQSSWDEAREGGHFRYDLKDLTTRILPGEFGFVAQLNTKRATHRRKPQEMISVAQPFNPKNFNFTKVKPGELVVDINSTSQILMEIARKQKDGEVPRDSRNVIVINVSPLEYCSILLVPSINSHLPQALTLDALQIAIEMILLSAKRSFRIGWNGLCALASVNHLHFHAYYLEYQLRIETEPTKQLSGPCHEIPSWPVPGFVFQLEDGDVLNLARNVYKVTRYFHINEIAHNIFMTRGSVLGEQKDSIQTTLRIFIWPRNPVYGEDSAVQLLSVKNVDAFNVAFCEIAGHIPVKDADSFPLLTDQSSIEVMEKVKLPREKFESIQKDVAALF